MHAARLFRRALAGGLLAIGLAASASAQCQLNGKIKHVVYVEFDNVHFTRDNPNVPSDLEQMPNLLNFIKQNGTLDAGDHTVLISHTANDIMTTETGLYSDDQGIFIGNSFGVFAPVAGVETGLFPSAFFYWTDKVSDITPTTLDNFPALTTPAGKNVPAPWVPFTPCTVGAFSTANIVLERAPFDVAKVFGPTSAQVMEDVAPSTTHMTNDFIGAAIHCALSDNTKLCTSANNAVADTLNDEPGGYNGYMALFGMKYIVPALGFTTSGVNAGIPVYNNGKGSNANLTGFSQLNFDPTAAQTLAVVEAMLKQGIPVVYAYIADAHDNQEGAGLSAKKTFGPGEAPYAEQLADYNAAFGTFFSNLAKDGIDQSNTLFIFTPDEGDHFVGGTPTPAGCDGVKITGSTVTPDVPCVYVNAPSTTPNPVGELDYDLADNVDAIDATAPAFQIHFDDSATTYVNGMPLDNDSSVRTLERTMGDMSAVNPHTGLSESLLGTGLGADLQGAIVDQAAQKLIHMHSSLDPARDPTFTFFGNPNFFFEGQTPIFPNLAPVVGTSFAWNHGDIQPEIARTFIGIVGPGVKNLGVTTTSDFWTDHVDVRPTMMFLTGLPEDYQHDGRVILELLDKNILPKNLEKHSDTLQDLGQLYKQIDAPFGSLSQSTLTVSTYGILSDSSGDAVYNKLEDKINSWTSQRDELASQIKSLLEGAEFSGWEIDDNLAKDIIKDGQDLLDQASDCAANPGRCATDHGHDFDKNDKGKDKDKDQYSDNQYDDSDKH